MRVLLRFVLMPGTSLPFTYDLKQDLPGITLLFVIAYDLKQDLP